MMKSSEEYSIIYLPEGLRCIHRQTNSSVAYCGVAVNAGSSGDPENLPGLAHFVEHTIFKGTSRRSGWQINNTAEAVGGELNAYTTKEETLIHLAVPAGYTARSLSLLSDLVTGATFPEKEAEREKEVVAEEINSYLDSPSDSAFDEFEDRLYAGSCLGHNILGNPESLRRITRNDCRAFIERFYTADNMVLFCSDAMSHTSFEKIAKRYFGAIKSGESRNIHEIPPMNAGFSEQIDHSGHQSNTILGGRLFNRYDNRRFALFLLNNYLGGPSMNSRLNRELREKRGYVYSADSYVTLLSESGHIQIFFGCDRDNTKKCLRLIRRELEKLAESPMKPAMFERIKRQYTGQILVASDHNESMASGMGKSLLYYGELHGPEWTSQRVSEVTAEDMRSVAETVALSAVSSLEIC